MEFTFETHGPHTLLVYTVKDNDVIDSMSLGMLSNNKINGIAPTQFMQVDTTKYIKYNVSSHIPVRQVFSGTVNKIRLLGVFKGVTSAILSAEEYMIDINSIILDLDYIFTNVSTGDTFMICLPIDNLKGNNDNLNSFFKDIMFSTQFDQTENCDYIATLINYLNANPVLSVVDFNELLISIENNSPSQPARPQMNPVPQPVVTPQVQPQQPQAHPAAQNVNSAPSFVPRQPQMNPPKPQGAVPPSPQAKPQAPAPGFAPPPPKAAGMAIPGKKMPEPTVAPEANGEKISFFYLMQHYNKENAAAYKAQKEAKKRAKNGANTTPQNIHNNVAQPNGVGFAVPGQQPPAQPNPAQQQTPRQVPPQQMPPQRAPQQSPQMPPRPVNNAQPQQPAVNQPAFAQPQQPAVNQPAFAQPQAPQGRPMNFGETTVLGAGGAIGETTVLGASPETQVQPHLIRSKNNEKINLNKPVFRIGKEKSYVDYFIGDNSAISRSHANIITRDGEYFVVDTNSTNHTYVNGQMIQSNVETKIAHGAKIKLANEDFEFRIY